jgi:3-(3-hydroxy-phenyl)propionate hydroxylase
VLFAGDAAHLVPIFGVRGLNSGLDDAGNLAWKLALVLQHAADASLLDSYSQERVHATRQNLAYGAKSTEFMAPPHAGFKLMREAALRLAGEDARVRSLINPRQSTPIRYDGSPMNIAAASGAPGARDAGPPAPRAGDTAPEARLGDRHLTTLFGHGFVALWFSDRPVPASPALTLDPRDGLASLSVWRIARTPVGDDPRALFDDGGEAWQRYAAQDGSVVLVRPDGYVLGRWVDPDAATLAAALAPFRQARPADRAREARS